MRPEPRGPSGSKHRTVPRKRLSAGAHRLICGGCRCDLVLVMKDGRVVEQGTFAELKVGHGPVAVDNMADQRSTLSKPR